MSRGEESTSKAYGKTKVESSIISTASEDNRKRLSTSNEDVIESKRSKNITSGFLATLKCYIAERKGERDEMQDSNTCLLDCIKDYPQLQPKVSRISYFGVFDGHGGTRASQYCAKNLHRHLARLLPKAGVSNFEKEMKKAVLDAFKFADDEFLKIAAKNQPVWKDGSTACCLLILDDTLYIANLGDSKAILCRYHKESKRHAAFPLCREHNPTNYDERKRIEKSGGCVRDGRVLGVLEVSRSIGDGQYKRCGVVNVPDVKRCHLTCDDRFILMACDGLWKVYSADQAVEFILNIIQDNNLNPPAESTKTVQTYRFETACNKLASEAVRRGSADNVTCIIVSISKL